MTYAVVWSEDGGPVYAGKLESNDRSIRLEGTAREASESVQRLFYDELAGVRVERRPEARLGGSPTLVLERRNGALLRVACVHGRGEFAELVERLSDRTGE